MNTKTTNGVKISVETFYQPKYSRPTEGEFVFAYRIIIENFSEDTVKLLRRHWRIFDSIGEHSEVEGEGVVGKQPVLRPNASHQYVSGCHLKSEMGHMRGTYLFENEDTGEEFKVKIPEFTLTAPLKLN
jgi:ApaG protein